jgi:putative ABC transport system ATP-binding protein
VIECESLVRIFRTGSVEVQALQGLDLTVAEGELIAVVGASGSGKSTLLGLLAGIDEPTAGRAVVAGRDLVGMSGSERVRYRRHTVGYVRQRAAANLLPYLSARQAVELPMTFAGTSRAERRTRARDLLDLMGVGAGADRRPGTLSGGEQMRVALAVALANRPRVLLADEPTGELDTATSAEVFAALRTVNRDLGVTTVIVTHDPAVSGEVARTVAIRDGRTSSEVLRGPDAAAEEYAVLDRAGRVQLPREHREALALTRRVRLALEGDHIAVRADDR